MGYFVPTTLNLDQLVYDSSKLPDWFEFVFNKEYEKQKKNLDSMCKKTYKMQALPEVTITIYSRLGSCWRRRFRGLGYWWRGLRFLHIRKSMSSILWARLRYYQLSVNAQRKSIRTSVRQLLIKSSLSYNKASPNQWTSPTPWTPSANHSPTPSTSNSNPSNFSELNSPTSLGKTSVLTKLRLVLIDKKWWDL